MAKDKDSAPEEPTPDLEEAWENYVETMSLPDTWIDGIALKALSTRIGVPLIIWKLKDGVWLRTTLAPQFRDYIALGKKIASPPPRPGSNSTIPFSNQRQTKLKSNNHGCVARCLATQMT